MYGLHNLFFLYMGGDDCQHVHTTALVVGLWKKIIMGDRGYTNVPPSPIHTYISSIALIKIRPSNYVPRYN